MHPFEQQTGCQVHVKIGNTSDEMVQLMRTGQYDGVSASGDATLRLIYAGDVAPDHPGHTDGVHPHYPGYDWATIAAWAWGLSRAADYSRLSIAAAAVLALGGGRDGRRAAVAGLASVAVTATVANVAIKPLARRARPDRIATAVPLARQVPMPVSSSLPSGHAAAAFAFATGVGHVSPAAAIPLRLLAALVAYSRVHTGVHFPGDVVAGSLLGGALAQATVRALDRRT